jgi:hypothetical protein
VDEYTEPTGPDQPTTLYRLFDDGGALLYVGISGRWAGRLAHHAATQGWWDEVTKITRESYPTRPEALAAEQVAIEQERPRYNVRTTPRPVRRKPHPAPQAGVPWTNWMPTLPPARPGEPRRILWIEGITSQQALIEWLLRASKALDQRAYCDGYQRWNRRVEFIRTAQGELCWRCKPCIRPARQPA